MIEWLFQRYLFLCNTAFQHPSRHRTTWEGRFKPPGTTHTVPVYNTIDFIIIPTKYRSLLCDSRGYAGMETISDRRQVVSCVHLSNMHKIWRRRSKTIPKRIPIQDLSYQHSKRTEYIHQVRDSITASVRKESAQECLNVIRQILTAAARETVGIVSHPSHHHHQNQFDSEIFAKSKEQRNLRTSPHS